MISDCQGIPLDYYPLRLELNRVDSKSKLSLSSFPIPIVLNLKENSSLYGHQIFVAYNLHST